MSSGARQPAGAASRGDGAGTDARGRATQGAVAGAGTDARRTAAGEDALRRAQARRNAWLLGGLAVFFYIGYMVWIFLRSNGG